MDGEARAVAALGLQLGGVADELAPAGAHVALHVVAVAFPVLRGDQGREVPPHDFLAAIAEHGLGRGVQVHHLMIFIDGNYAQFGGFHDLPELFQFLGGLVKVGSAGIVYSRSGVHGKS